MSEKIDKFGACNVRPDLICELVKNQLEKLSSKTLARLLCMGWRYPFFFKPNHNLKDVFDE